MSKFSPRQPLPSPVVSKPIVEEKPTVTQVAPARMADKMSAITVCADRVEYAHPTIELVHHIFVGQPREQVNKLTPAKCFIAHGVIVIEEMKLTIPVLGALIRT